MDPAKLRALLFEKDKQKNSSGMSNSGQSMPMNKSSPNSMSPGLPNPMGFHQSINSMQKPQSIGMPKTMGSPKMNLPNPTAAPSVIGKQPSLPQFGKMKKALKANKGF